MNNYPHGSYNTNESMVPDSIDISFEPSIVTNILYEKLGNDDSIFKPPDLKNRLGCNGTSILLK